MRLLLTLLVSSALLAVQAVPNLPEQVHIAYGTEHDSISVSWSTPLDSTPSVHYVSWTVGLLPKPAHNMCELARTQSSPHTSIHSQRPLSITCPIAPSPCVRLPLPISL